MTFEPKYVADPFARLYFRNLPPRPPRPTPEEQAHEDALKEAWLANPKNRKKMERRKAEAFAQPEYSEWKKNGR